MPKNSPTPSPQAGQSLKRVCEAAGCRTQVELAAFLGIRQSSISDAMADAVPHAEAGTPSSPSLKITLSISRATPEKAEAGDRPDMGTESRSAGTLAH